MIRLQDSIRADDYMTKPFEPIELVARVRAITRRQGEVVIDKAHFGDLTLDLSTHELSTETSSVHLSQKEFEVMQILMSSNGRVVSKQVFTHPCFGDTER